MHVTTPLLKTHLKFDSAIFPIRIPPAVIMLHPLKRSMVVSSIASLVVRPSHSEKQEGGEGGRGGGGGEGEERGGGRERREGGRGKREGEGREGGRREGER